MVVREAGSAAAPAFRAVAAGTTDLRDHGGRRGALLGHSSAAELGTGSSRMLTPTLAPIRVRTDTRLASVDVGKRFACGLTAEVPVRVG